jgi:hypothetical protein
MHTPVSGTLRLSALISGGIVVAFASGASGQQTPVEAVTNAPSSVQRAQALLLRGQRDSAAMLLGARVTEQPSDGRAWFFLGRIHLADAQQWHRAGHPGETSSASLLLDFAGTSFEPAQELLTDSGGVFRVVVAIERATLRIETAGWGSLATWRLPAEELPLPPVLAELGRNLLASCPTNGVLLTGSSVAEAAAVWGIRLQGDRSDVVLLRPDMYQWDHRYRAQMAAVLGADSASELAAALTSAARKRPICLAPTVDPMVAPNLSWESSRLVLATATANVQSASVSLFRFARTGLNGSVWTAAARDIYDLAARHNRGLCNTLFTSTDALTPPTIPACSQ